MQGCWAAVGAAARGLSGAPSGLDRWTLSAFVSSVLQALCVCVCACYDLVFVYVCECMYIQYVFLRVCVCVCLCVCSGIIKDRQHTLSRFRP